MKAKTFDCVAMKHGIQQALKEKCGHLSRAERNALVREAMRKDPHLSRLLELARPPAPQS